MSSKQEVEVEQVVDDATQAVIDDLKKQVAELTAANQAKDIQLEEQQDAIKKLHASRAGWLISGLNPLYDGRVYGVQFINGQAFIQDDAVIEHFVHKPLKDSELAKMTPAQREAAIERQTIPSSRLAAEAMKNDFGYSIQHFDGDDESLQRILDMRVKERIAAQQIIDAMKEGAVDPYATMQPYRSGMVQGG